MKPDSAPRRTRIRRAAKILVPIVALGGVLAYLLLKPIPVDIFEVTRGGVRVEVMGTGTLEAHIAATISPRIQGRLVQVMVDQNDNVRTGQLLAQLDDGELSQQVEISRASLASARATVDRVRSDQARAEAVSRLTELDHKRSTELIATHAISQADYDKAFQGLRVAGADLQRAQSAITEAEYQVVTAEKTLLFQQERLADTRLTSPLDGLVVKRERNPGDVVVPGGSVLQVVSTQELWISAWVDESAMSGLAPGQPARVVFRSEPEKTYAGEVVRLGRQVDPEAREFLVDVRVNELPANWAIGQRADVRITTGEKAGTLGIDARAVQYRDRQPGVFVAENGRARWRPITPGARGGNRLEVTRGLAAGEHIVLPRDAKQALKDGARVATSP